VLSKLSLGFWDASERSDIEEVDITEFRGVYGVIKGGQMGKRQNDV
jgi:hypothetical protein